MQLRRARCLVQMCPGSAPVCACHALYKFVDVLCLYRWSGQSLEDQGGVGPGHHIQSLRKRAKIIGMLFFLQKSVTIRCSTLNNYWYPIFFVEKYCNSAARLRLSPSLYVLDLMSAILFLLVTVFLWSCQCGLIKDCGPCTARVAKEC